ncbi:MAG: response regulator transcription factor [Defluviitaleaceae bacterium]|nr:response regulator transcription factor [Defluviitaleaceae bacterium]
MILIVEDEKNIADILAFNLKKEGYEVLCAYNGIEGLNYALEKDPELILLDIMMPGMDGFTLCKRLRKTSEVPIIMLTARSEEVDKVLGLEIGADDYVTKPFSMRELMARVRANLRKRATTEEVTVNEIMELGEIKIDPKKYTVMKGSRSVALTSREFDLLLFLAKEKGQVFNREVLLERVWGYEYFGDARTVDVTIRRLRTKLEDVPEEPKYVLTKRGVGYYFLEEDE